MSLPTRGMIDPVRAGGAIDRRSNEAVISQLPTAQPRPTEFAREEWGLALTICGIVGLALFRLYRKQQAAEALQNRQLTLYILKQNQELLGTLSKLLAEFIARKS
jgi:GAF domain-containing protein